MAIRPENLPADPAVLTEMVLAFDGEIENLRATIATLRGLIFGARSERSAAVLSEQLTLDLAASTAAAPPSPANDDHDGEEGRTKGKRRRKAKRNIGALPAHLPRCEEVIEPPSTLSAQMHRIGEEASEALDRAPTIVRVLRTVRPKYAVVPARGRSSRPSAGAADRGRHGLHRAGQPYRGGLEIRLALTLYRQTQILAGYGVTVDRQTLARWMNERHGWPRVCMTCNCRPCTATSTFSATRRRCRCSTWAGSHPQLPVLGARHGRSGLARSGAAGGGLCVRRPGQRRSRATRRPLRRPASRRLRRLQIAGEARTDQGAYCSGVLSRACKT